MNVTIVTIVPGDGRMEVPCKPLTEHFCIAEIPALEGDLEGKYCAGPSLTHIPTGFAVTVLFDYRERLVQELADYLEKLPIDWDSTDPEFLKKDPSRVIAVKAALAEYQSKEDALWEQQ